MSFFSHLYRVSFVLIAAALFSGQAHAGHWGGDCSGNTGFETTAPDGTPVITPMIVQAPCHWVYVASDFTGLVDAINGLGDRAGGGRQTDSGLAGGINPLVDCDNAGAAPTTTHPVIIASGKKVKDEVDFMLEGDIPFGVTRFYGKGMSGQGVFGSNWASSIEYALLLDFGNEQACEGHIGGASSCPHAGTPITIIAKRPEGFGVRYVQDGSVWRDGNGGTISTQGTGWLLEAADGNKETYDSLGRPVTIKSARNVGLTYAYSPTTGKLATITDTAGRNIQFAWTGFHITQVTAPTGAVYTYGYTSVNLTSVTYPSGLGSRGYLYENSRFAGALTGIMVNGVRYSRYTYDAHGKVQQSGLEPGIEQSTFLYTDIYTDVTNTLGSTTRYNYAIGATGSRNLASIQKPASSTCPASARSLFYDANGNLDYTISEAGVRDDYTYDAVGHLTRKVEGIAADGSTAMQRITDYVWDPAFADRLLQVKSYGASTSAPLNETTYAYYPDGDGKARLLQSVSTVNKTAVGVANETRTTTYTYSLHPSGLVSQKIEDGPIAGTLDRVTYNYDAQGNLTSIVGATGNTTSYSAFNGWGEPTVVTDPNGVAKTSSFDAKGRLIQESQPTPAGTVTETIQYNGFDRPTLIQDNQGGSTNFTYDQAGRLTKKSLPGVMLQWTSTTHESQEDYENYAYNTESRLTGTTKQEDYSLFTRTLSPLTDWSGNTYVTSKTEGFVDWDANGHLAAERGSNGQNVRYTYNAQGKVVTTTDSSNRTRTFYYDSVGRMERSVAFDGAETRVAYDFAGRPWKITDPKGNVTTYTRDGLGNVVSESNGDTGTTTYLYDTAGNIQKLTRADTSYVTMLYDGSSRITKATAWAPVVGTQIRTFAYDACTNGKGRLCSVTDPSGSNTYTYTTTGQVATQTTVIDGASYATSFTYDAMGRLLTATYPNGYAVRYTYQAREGKAATVEALVSGVWKTVVSGAFYEAFGNERYVGFGNGAQRNIDRDVDGRTTKVQSAAIQDLALGYDNRDNVTAITNSVNSAGTYAFTYDGSSRLASSDSSNGNESWTFDANDNRASHTWGGVIDSYLPQGTTNRLSAVSGSRPHSFSMDTIGRVTGDTTGGVTSTYTYDSFGRMLRRIRANQVVDCQPGGSCPALPSGTWQYRYDAFEQRVSKTSLDANGGVISRNRYLYGPDGKLIGETAGGATALSTSYVWFNGDVVGLVRGGNLYFVHDDDLGRPEAITDSAQGVVWRAVNMPYDRRVTLDAVGGFNIGFPGQYYDAEGATWQNHFRDYDPNLGRYMQPDPIGLAAGMSVYAYVGANPVRYVDSLGLVNDIWIGQLGEWSHEMAMTGLRVGGGITAAGVGGYLIGKYAANPALNGLTTLIAGRPASPGTLIYDWTHDDSMIMEVVYVRGPSACPR